MGVHVSKNASEELRKRNKQVEQMLADDKRKEDKIFKMLLLGMESVINTWNVLRGGDSFVILGAGDSGKSTIIKQMKILHADGFDNEEMEVQRSLVEGNIIQSICTMIQAMKHFDIKFANAEREPDANRALQLDNEWSARHPKLNTSDWAILQRLWRDDGVQACFARASEYQLSDSTKYFCDDMERVAAPEYVPSVQDALRTRTATAGIVEMSFTLRRLTLKVIDVGGQRSQRKKWIHCFDNINALIFVASMSEYNQVLQEDKTMNRMQESLKLFEMVVNSQWFVKSSVVLFLNKKDLFSEKVKHYPLEQLFPEYKGGSDYDLASNFIMLQYEGRKNDPDKAMYIHKTCATDTKNIDFVLESCFDILLKSSLAKSGLI